MILQSKTKNFTVTKVPKLVVMTNGSLTVQMDFPYDGNTVQITYDLGLAQKMLKSFVVGTVQSIKGKGEKKGGRQ